jgi:hypothetical protein
MASIIPSPPVREDSTAGCNHLLPPFLQLNSKITYEHDGHYHKGFLGIRNGVYRFIYKSHVNKHKEDWGVELSLRLGRICASRASFCLAT